MTDDAMTDQFLVVVYDISDDKRRTRLHNTLLNYGTPVQYSVFECLLEPEQVNKMKEAVERVIHPELDHRLTYQQCFEVQTRWLAKVVEGKKNVYVPFLTR